MAVKCDQTLACRTRIAPLQGCGELKGIRRSQRMHSEKPFGRETHGLKRLYLSPGS